MLRDFRTWTAYELDHPEVSPSEPLSYATVQVSRWLGPPRVWPAGLTEVAAHTIGDGIWYTVTARWALAGLACRADSSVTVVTIGAVWQTRVLFSPSGARPVILRCDLPYLPVRGSAEAQALARAAAIWRQKDSDEEAKLYHAFRIEHERAQVREAIAQATSLYAPPEGDPTPWDSRRAAQFLRLLSQAMDTPQDPEKPSM